jgi:hypothetical protein
MAALQAALGPEHAPSPPPSSPPPPPPSKKDGSSVPAIVASIIGAMLLVALFGAGLVFLSVRSRRRRRSAVENISSARQLSALESTPPDKVRTSCVLKVLSSCVRYARAKASCSCVANQFGCTQCS